LIQTIPHASNLKFDMSEEEANRTITTKLVRYLMLCFTSRAMRDRFSKIESWGSDDYRAYAEYLNEWPLIDYALRFIKENSGQNGRVPELVTTLVRQLIGDRAFVSYQPAPPLRKSPWDLLHGSVRSVISRGRRLNSRASNVRGCCETNHASYFLGSFMDCRFRQNNASVNEDQAASEDIQCNTLNAAAELPELPHAKALLLTCTQDDGHAERKTPLIISAQKGLTAATQVFLDQNVDKDARDNSGRTALHYAAENCDEAIVRLLVEQGASRDISDNVRKIALELAIDNMYIPPMRD